MQAAYVCDEAERASYIRFARDLAHEYSEATTSPRIRAVLDEAMEELERDRCWEAMRIVRDLFVHDDLMLADAPAQGHPA